MTFTEDSTVAKRDISVVDYGSICLLFPLSNAARAWVEENLPEDRQYFGPGIVVEPRYIDNIVEGARQDGLRV